MTNNQTIFVTGATGRQGGAVARHLLNNGFKVKALTRNGSSPKAKALQISGAEVVTGDLNDPSSYSHYLKGVQGVFSVQTFEEGIEKEIKQGTTLADVAKEKKVNHFIYSSVSGADLQTGIPHWDSKNIIEQHVKQSGLSFTILRPASLYENFLLPQVSSRLIKGKLVSPINKQKVQQFVSTEDIGKITARICANPEQYQGQTITLAAEQMNLEELATIFSEAIGKEVKYQKLPAIITRLVMGQKLFRMFKWINENDAIFIKDLPAFKKAQPQMKGFKEWIKEDFTVHLGADPV